MSKETNQFYEMVAERYTQIEEAKAEALERGEIIFNMTAAHENGELSDEDYTDLINNL